MSLDPHLGNAQTCRVDGIVSALELQRPLTGANISLLDSSRQIVDGVASDRNGTFHLVVPGAAEYQLVARFVGYAPGEMVIACGDSAVLRVELVLVEEALEFDAVVVTGSRRAEKIMDAPASVSLITSDEIEASTGHSAIDAMRSTVGVHVAQIGIDNRELTTRGFNNWFNGNSLGLYDYREVNLPALGVLVYAAVPTTRLDVDRIEIVRGPSAALYGGGAGHGVIHMISKSPLDHPGTSLSIAGGERSYGALEFRHAGVLDSHQKLGYKIVGQFSRADDWMLDPLDPVDAVQLADDVIPERLDEMTRAILSSELQYRPNSAVSISLAGGRSTFSGNMLTGAGHAHPDGWSTSYAQLRGQVGRFFASVDGSWNSAGNTFMYAQDVDRDGDPDLIVDNSFAYHVQTQYRNENGGRHRFVVGADADFTVPRTGGTITGRREGDDHLAEYGAYAQSTYRVDDRWEATAALRADYSAVYQSTFVSPRAGIVFKPSPSHSLRATWNHSYVPEGYGGLFIDINIGRIEGTDVLLTYRENPDGWTWPRNPIYQAVAGSDLVASSIIPENLGALTPTGLSLDYVYEAIYGVLSETDPADLAVALQQQGLPVDAVTVSQLISLLSPDLTMIEGFSAGSLGRLTPSGQLYPLDQLDPFPGKKPRFRDMVEVGYRGLLGERLVVSADLFFSSEVNFYSSGYFVTPLVFVPNLSSDLAASMVNGINANGALAAALQGFGLTAEQAAALIVELAGSGLPGPDVPVAIVQPEADVPGPGMAPELIYSKDQFGRLDYFGIDVSAAYMVDDQWSVFANASWVSDNVFDYKELGGKNPEEFVIGGIPRFKANFGGTLGKYAGWDGRLSFRYNGGFPMTLLGGIGDVPAFFLVDLSVGYDLGQTVTGLRLDLGISNLLDDGHREMIGGPRIGRMAILRATYQF